MKYFLSLIILLSCFSAWAQPKLFCHGDGLRSTLFYWDGVVSYEFADIEFKGPKYLETYLACTNFIFSIKNKDRSRIVSYAPLLNSYKKSFVRFSGSDKELYYQHCLNDTNCSIKFPYSLLEPRLFLEQFFEKKTSLKCGEEEKIELPTSFDFPQNVSQIQFWELPETDLIKAFWFETKAQEYDSIYLSAMTYSLDFLNRLQKHFQGKPVKVYIMASFNMMSLDERLVQTLKKLPTNIIYIPIYQSANRPYSHHQKGAVLISKNKTKVIWNSANFRRYETHQLIDIGMTVSDPLFAKSILNRWMKTAADSCAALEARSCNLKQRYSNSAKDLKFWNTLSAKSCERLPVPIHVSENKTSAHEVLLSLITNAKKSISVHTHVFGNSLILKKLKEAHERGIEVKVIGGKPTDLKSPLKWIRFNKSKQEYHAKFVLIDGSTFFWGTGNITKTSFNNQREDFFHGSHPQVIAKLQEYFNLSWEKTE